MSGRGECSAWGGKTAWGRNEEDCEPIVSFVEIMSEDLADSLNDEERRKEEEFLSAVAESESLPTFTSDEEMARALQREFDREYELAQVLAQEKKVQFHHIQSQFLPFDRKTDLVPNILATVTVTPDRYCPKTAQESDQSSDDEDVRQFATDLLYAKVVSHFKSFLISFCLFRPLSLHSAFIKLTDEAASHTGAPTFRNAAGETVTKHDAKISAMRNADKTMNDKVNLAFGDMHNKQLNSRVFNSLRNFSKTEAKRQHKLKDKEEKATIETSMDAVTRLHLFKWINQGVFDRVEGVIATGKESAVLNAINNESGERFAIKVYKTSLTEFKNRSEYVKDDFRFKNPRGVLKIWAEREFMNLSRMVKCGIPCPVPVKLKRHLLLMTLIAEEGSAAPRLKNIDWEFSTIMSRMYRDCKLVHGDLSEFNLLLSEGKVYVIDVSQAMDLSHPRNLHFLIRDIENVLSYFQRLDIPDLPTPVALFNMITGLAMSEEGSLIVQVEQFSEENRAHQINKSKPADFEWAAYNKERKEQRGESPARDYN
ncbi:unnamed protein product [Nippostrongylus brasiliensis]|uniref:Serine/threonine-protein kinase RIO3 n=1 Tax=Nippostrongylus brasiliensis TaxID=27835 RepID=A0A0N4Y4C4_NIPBR|nr:unnamed protein product [Nippostrongylus brasiliensis]